MNEIKKLINETQSKLKKLHSLLQEKNIDFDGYIFEMVECLSYIEGYSERAIETVIKV